MLEFFDQDLRSVDPDVAGLIGYEAERQARKLIMIPSESQAPAAVRAALGSVFQNIYAEGYPDASTIGLSEAAIMDYDLQLARYRRSGDQRYYKGVEYANIIEALARRRAADAFAANEVPAEQIRANVQPLSGSPANSAIYAALVPIGSTIMGMDLLHGGHLTHGSPANRSGKLYKVVSYGIDAATERLDYDAIEALAREHRPKLIIAGFTSYPWMPDWARFRQIADSVGAYLLADISHIAGMVAAQVVASPIGHAHVISFTTHKTLYGPRGACILTTDDALAAKIDSAVFPGEQGGPHVNAIAGMAVAFKLAQTEDFARLQQQVVDNAAHLAAALQHHGLRVSYGGTDTHMLLVDCKTIRATDGISPDGKKGTPLMGDSAARILDLAGIVCNRNTIPGDKSARVPSGVRLGTPWLTQRGFKEPEIERLAEIIARVLKATRPHSYAGRYGPVYFAKADFDVLEQAKWDVVDLACCVDLGPDYEPSGYPHHYFMYKPTTDPGGEWDVIDIHGQRARGFCNVAMTNDVYLLGPGESQQTWVLESDGRLMSPGVLKRVGEENAHFQLLTPKSAESRVVHWLRALSDGFVVIDPDDLYARAPGPLVLKRLPHELAETWEMCPPDPADFETDAAGWATHKPFWIGHCGRDAMPGGLPALSPFTWEPDPNPAIRRTRLFETHRNAGAKMVPFAGWEMPVQYTSVQEEHLAVRQKAGLFDVSHMGLFEFSGDNVHLFLNTIATNDVSLIEPGESQYSFLLAEDGGVMDDVWIYRVDQQRYWMVVNAANSEKDWAWIDAVRRGGAQIDPERPWARALGTETVKVRDFRDPATGSDMRVQLALQGPRSRDVLLAMMAPDGPDRDPLAEMKRNEILRVEIEGFDLYISRTGYTGEPVAFEIFVHPDRLVDLWSALLQTGAPFGLRPIGLAAATACASRPGCPSTGTSWPGLWTSTRRTQDLRLMSSCINRTSSANAPTLPTRRERRLAWPGFGWTKARADARPGRCHRQPQRARRGSVTSCSIDSEGRLTGLGYVQEPNHRARHATECLPPQ